ncbi:MAG: ComEC family competence protein [Candidatus Pacebacteria bacterium]|nr:ComEC family competence protein [Candidatus Paceibacterota bacterium]
MQGQDIKSELFSVKDAGIIKRKFAYFLLFMLSTLFVTVRYCYADFDNTYLKNLFDQNKSFQFEGIIISDPEFKKTYWKYEVLVKNNSTDIGTNPKILSDRGSKILVKEKSRTTELKNSSVNSSVEQYSNSANLNRPTYGDYIRFDAKITKPKLIEGSDGRDFDYEYFLQKDNIFYIADAENVHLIGTGQADKITQTLYLIKRKFMQNIEDILPAPYAFLATGLIISGKGSLDKELQEQFQKVGLIHIVVLSGSNVSIVGEAISKFFSFLPKFWGGIFGSVGIILFGVMTGGGATVCRSVIMSIIGIYARLSGRNNSALVSLIVAGFLMLFQNPKLLLHDPSFQLSFMATLGLIFLGSPIEDILKRTKDKLQSLSSLLSSSLKYIPQSFVSLIATTIATQIFTLPFIIKFSGVVSLVAIPVNALVLPLIPLTMLFVFLTGVISFMTSLLAFLPAFVSWVLLKYELVTVGYFSALPFAAITLPPITPLIFFGMYFIVILISIFLNTGKSLSEKMGSVQMIAPS